MPGSTEILDGLAAIAKSWQLLALLWHVYFGSLAIAVLRGWRPAQRPIGAALVPPVLSVSILAWMEGNPFNGSLFGILAIALVILLRSLGVEPVRLASAPWLGVGGLLLIFGWVYPHFLEEESILVYLYAAPLGLVPCPSLAAVAGTLMVFRGLDSRACSWLVSGAAAFYGLFGSWYLGVTIDWVLLAGAAGMVPLAARLASDRNARAG